MVDAVFPDVKLKTALLFHSVVAKILNVGYESVEERVQAERFGLEEAVEGLTEVENAHVDRVLALIDQVEHFNDDGVVEQVAEIHLEHEVQGVFFLEQAPDWLANQLVELSNVVLFLKVFVERLKNVIVQEVALGDQRIDLLLFDFERNPVVKQGYFDRVELTQDRVVTEVLALER